MKEMTIRRNITALIVAGIVLPIILMLSGVVGYNKSVTAGSKIVKNIIVLIPDGCSSDDYTAARWYKGSPLTLEEMACGLVRTFNSDSLITDSAPAATAYATGHKTGDKMVGILSDINTAVIPGTHNPSEQTKFMPVASVLEGAKMIGKATGLIATSNIQHATPAGFSSHWYARSNYTEIAEQQVYQNIDVVFGGGLVYLKPKSKGGKRADEEDLVDVLKSNGYDFITTRDELKEYNGNKVWGMFADDAMAYELDRPTTNKNEPSLAEMTSKAIEVLSKDNDGFFLMVEGSKVDWAAHANDPVATITDVIAFDNAVKVALDYAKKDGNTIVIAFTDHGNGGFTIGDRATNDSYSKLPFDKVFAPLKKATLTGEGIEKMLKGSQDNTAIKAMIKKYFAVEATDEEVNKVKTFKPGEWNYGFGPIISSRANIGWTTNGHTGEDITLYAYGPTRPEGTLDNTDIAKYIATSLGFNLEQITSSLFQDANIVTQNRGITMEIDKSNPENIVLKIKKDNMTAELPTAKNIVKVGGTSYAFKGLTIYSPKTERIYIPEEAIVLLIENGF
jgi:alkaline phosphatase